MAKATTKKTAASAEPEFAKRLSKDPTAQHEAFVEWAEERTGLELDVKSVQTALVLYGTFQRSDENQASLAERRQSAEARTAEREKNREARARKAAERAAAPAPAKRAAKKVAAAEEETSPKRRTTKKAAVAEVATTSKRRTRKSAAAPADEDF